MAGSWQAKLSSYTFDLDVLPLNQGGDKTSELSNYFDLLCIATDWKTRAKHSISIVYSPRFSGHLQGTVDGSDEDYEITITTNSSVLIQHVQWALALPSTKVFFVAGSSTNGDYPFAVTTFTFSPLRTDPALDSADITLPKITADTPDDLRQALELRRVRQARLRATPREGDGGSGVRHGASAASRFVTAVQHAAQRAREGRKPGG